MAKDKQKKCISRIRYIDYDSTDKQPKLAVYAIDRKRMAIKVSVVNDKGEFSLPDSAVEKADTIVVGPKTDDVSTLDRKLLVSYRPSQFKAIMDTTGRFEIPKLKWYPWLTLRKWFSVALPLAPGLAEGFAQCGDTENAIFSHGKIVARG